MRRCYRRLPAGVCAGAALGRVSSVPARRWCGSSETDQRGLCFVGLQVSLMQRECGGCCSCVLRSYLRCLRNRQTLLLPLELCSQVVVKGALVALVFFAACSCIAVGAGVSGWRSRRILALASRSHRLFADITSDAAGSRYVLTTSAKAHISRLILPCCCSATRRYPCDLI